MLFQAPEPSRTDEIFSDETTTNDTLCNGPNYEWTSWYSATTPNGNDFETLLDHRKLNK